MIGFEPHPAEPRCGVSKGGHTRRVSLPSFETRMLARSLLKMRFKGHLTRL